MLARLLAITGTYEYVGGKHLTALSCNYRDCSNRWFSELLILDCTRAVVSATAGIIIAAGRLWTLGIALKNQAILIHILTIIFAILHCSCLCGRFRNLAWSYCMELTSRIPFVCVDSLLDWLLTDIVFSLIRSIYLGIHDPLFVATNVDRSYCVHMVIGALHR